MQNGSAGQPRRAPWDLIACGPEGDGPFRLVLYYPHGSITEYFPDVETAFRAIETAEQSSVTGETLMANKTLIGVPGEMELVKEFFREEAWASGARH
jgi:hypothetical protein